jgi:peptidoglycan/xylan/chitin deacetylase (PgdA/CDA1 family)
MAGAPDTSDSLERTIGIEQGLGATASYLFTVVPDRPTHYDCVYDPGDRCTFRNRSMTVSSVMRTMHDEGFDIGLHGSWFSAIDQQFLASEHERLAAAVGETISSTRQHYLHYDIRRTPERQAGCGLRTDSSLGFNRNIGFRAGTSLPFHHYDLQQRRTLDLLEIPLVLQDGALFGTNALELSHDMAMQAVARMIETVADVNGVVTLLFHPHSLINPATADLYRRSLEYARDAGGWLTSLEAISGWWRTREQRINTPAPA